MVVHCWHKERASGVLLSGYLGEEVQLGEQCHPCTGEPEVGRLTAQRVHLKRSASRGDGEQEGSFPGQYLSGQVKMGSKEALDKVARTSSRHHEGVIMWEMPLECSRPLIHL